MYRPDTTALLKPATIRDFCDTYAEVTAQVDAAFASIASAKVRMDRLVERFNVIPQNLHDHSFSDGESTRVRTESAAMMKSSAWSELIRITGVLDVMTQKKRDEFRKAIDSGQTEPATYENVMAWLEGLRGDIKGIALEAIAEAANVLRPHDDRYKTNSPWKLGKRAIIANGVCFSYGSFHHSRRDGDVQSVDNAFHLLDGKGVPAHPDRLEDAIWKAIARKEQACETAYFACKWYRTGSLHFKFLRMDLVDELNLRAADHRTLRNEVA